MGTNYYLHRNICQCCKRAEEILHIGKSSAGWCFSLHVDPDKGLNDLDGWKALFPVSEIRNEYGDVLSAADFLKIVIERTWNAGGQDAEWHRLNQSEPGPNGLARTRIGSHCVGHGDGPWDLIPGEFS